MKKAETLIEEIKHITSQYRVEVGSRRKPWPNSIITRVQELMSLGFKIKKISDMTGIPYYSILNWRHRGQVKRLDKKFHSLALKPTNTFESRTATVPASRFNETATVTVTTPDGYQITIEGLESTLKLLEMLRGGKCF